ncbi:MAG TPA: transcription elongation factor GreA [Patescibacteria group bacterium]|jgi:transcription elongation factor GreA|nr:transcription elongation factor GreA [Patescibacteria group bacterium]
MTIIPFTKQGFESLKKDLEEEITKRPLAVEVLKRGREMGDLSENGLYKAAKFELANIDRQIRHLKNLILYGRTSEPKDNNTVQLGHTITVETGIGKKEFQIVGEWEANPKENKISIKSPIGHNLMGRKAGETIATRTPNGFINYKILSIK